MNKEQLRVYVQKRTRRKLRFSETIKYLSKEQIKRLIDSIDNIRDKVLIKFLYSTGMRVGETVLMQVDDIRFIDNEIDIPAQNTKSKKKRTPRISIEIGNDLKAYLKEFQITKGRVFPISIRNVQYIVKKYGKKVDLNWIHPHTLRHTHIVHSLMKGVTMSAVQKQVGHVDLNTTQIYSQLSTSDVKEAYNKAGVDF
ncbi:MAG: site-specific integrase [Nanoarchaeota archaeon]